MGVCAPTDGLARGIHPDPFTLCGEVWIEDDRFGALIPGAFGPIAFTLGIVFSFLITLAPAALFSVLLIARLLLR
jgi:hypothetical protein